MATIARDVQRGIDDSNLNPNGLDGLEMHEKVLYNKGMKDESLIASAKKYQQIAQEKPDCELSEVQQLRLENEIYSDGGSLTKMK